MAYGDGTPTSDEHATTARRLLTPGPGEGDRIGHTDQAFIDALRGIGHALLAVHDDLDTIRRGSI